MLYGCLTLLSTKFQLPVHCGGQFYLFEEAEEKHKTVIRVKIMVFNATFNKISIISWWSVLLVEEIEVPGENH
jgi:hypothetical protein